ncbi:MAG: alpha/beta fold hydrolase [Armatimonadota bacterium]
MLKRSLIAIAAVVGLVVAAPASAAKGSYASVNGLKMYYEIQGTGRPLVVLHGGLCTIEACLGKVRPPLAKARKTIAIEQQGHGRTADADRPLTFEQMAEDTAAVLRQLKIERADFFGYSDGGNVALRIAMRHPALVRKLVVFGTNYNNDGLVPGLVEAFKVMKAEDIPKEFREAYVKVAPDPKQWPTLVAKVMKQALEFKGWRPEEIKSIKAPTLIMIGDADIVRPEHAVEMFRLLPHAQLAVLPGTDHFAPVHRADWIVSMTKAFLDAPMPKAK